MPYKDKGKEKAWFMSHKDEKKTSNKAYRDSHKDEIKAYRESHKDEIKERKSEYDHAYYRLNKEKMKSPKRRYSSAKSVAKTRGLQFYLSFDEYTQLIQDRRCHYCGQVCGEYGGGLDRKDNEPFYRLDSVVPCCGRCNETFMDNYSYQEKLIIAKAIREVDQMRQSISKQPAKVI